MTRRQTLAVDDFKPAEIARQIESSGVAKARLAAHQVLTLAVLAGAFIGFGAAFFTLAMVGVDPGHGPARVLGGAVFALGLILVIVAGAELFTGNALMTIAAVDGLITPAMLLRNWGLVYVGNALGGAGLAVLIWAAGSLTGGWGDLAVRLAETKAALGAIEAFARGVLCNILVCLAVWTAAAARSVTGKVLVVLLPVAAFVALGFEHSVANFFFFAQGMLAGGDLAAGAVLHNLFWVTLGNIVGGVGGVALAYRLIWGRADSDNT
jgi:formate/nitrite transporter